MSPSRDDENEESLLHKLLQLIGENSDAGKERDSPPEEDENEEVLEKSRLEVLLDDSHEELEDTEQLSASTEGISADVHETFNEAYESYKSSNFPIDNVCAIKPAFFTSYNVKFTTPILQRILKSGLLPNPVVDWDTYGISRSSVKRLRSMNIDGVFDLPNNVRYFFNCINSYLDTFYVNDNVSQLKFVRLAYALHIANHVTKSREKSSRASAASRGSAGEEFIKCEGFTRPKVLVICGLRCIAKEVVENLLRFIPSSKNEKLDRFQSEFSLCESDLLEQREMFTKTKKPKDFVETFSGNQDDAFKIGLRYQSGLLHLFTPFYSSDIIIASPLGLKTTIGTKGDKEFDYDFLSSIEVVVCDRVDIIKFQNWCFFADVWKLLNLPLVKWRDSDINKIRASAIDGKLGEYRQNVLISCTKNVVFNAFFKALKNRRGSVRLFRPNTKDYILMGSKLKIQQLFIKVPSRSVKEADKDLLEHFVENILGSLTDIGGVLLVVGDYAQYLRIHKRLQDSNLEYLQCHEANTSKQVSFARQQFQSNSTPCIVTTSRFLFFKRYLLRGASRIFLLQPPEYPPIYWDFLRMVDLTKTNTIVCCYTKFHAILLEPIVGLTRLGRLLGAADTRITQFH